jgi:uncharacterized alpha-E superfamily protein
VISRVADHCFWLGRYLERVESGARVLLVTRNLALDAEISPRQCWQPVLAVTGQEPAFRARFGEPALEDGDIVQEYLTWDPENPASIWSSLRAARENARSIREVVSLETWEGLNELHLWFASPAAREEWYADRHGFFRRIRQAVQMVLGVMRSTMLHDDALDFAWLGLMLERAGQTARLVDVHHHALSRVTAHQVIETALWLSVLRACSGFEPYLKRHQGRVSPESVARFLVLARDFPRSVGHCLAVAYDRFCALRPPAEESLPGAAAQDRLRLLADELLRPGVEGRLEGAGLHDLLTHVVDESAAICELIGLELLGYRRGSGTAATAQ